MKSLQGMLRLTAQCSLFFVVTVLAGCTSVPQSTDGAVDVKLEALLSRPSELEGRRVAVEGYVLLSWEGGAIFASEQAHDEPDLRRAIRLVPSKDLGPPEQFDGTFGRIVGVFHSEPPESPGFPGSILISEVSVQRRFRPILVPSVADEVGSGV